MIKVICIGKLKKDYIKEAINDYLNRINKYHKILLIELPDNGITNEAKNILKHIDNNDYVISLCIEGKLMNSIELKDTINNLLISGKSNITFIIGGSDGLDESVKKISNLRLSFSPLTFPHNLFRLLLLEQLYRSFKMINGETYHK